jgi:hypothetical protein
LDSTRDPFLGIPARGDDSNRREFLMAHSHVDEKAEITLGFLEETCAVQALAHPVRVSDRMCTL